MAKRIEASNITKSSNTFELYRGQSKDLELVIKRRVRLPDGAYADRPVDTSTVTVIVTVKATVGDDRALIQKTSAETAEVETLGESEDGVVVVHFLPEDTDAREPGEYIYDGWVEYSPTERYPIIRNSDFIVIEPVTRF
jgi:hypothetical protein